MRNILKQSSFLLIAQSLTRVVGFFYTIYVARILGVESFGLYILALAFFSIISSFADFGFNRFLIREVAKDKAKIAQLLWSMIMIRLTLTSILFAAFAVILYLLDSDKLRVGITLLATLAVLPQAIALTFDAIFVAVQKLQFSALALIISSLLTSLLGVLFVGLGFGPTGAINALVIGQASYFLVLAIFLHKNNLLSFSSVSFPIIKKIVIGSLPYGILGIIGLVSFKIDTLVLSYFRGNFETGIYGAAYKFLETASYIPAALAVASFPVFSRMVETDTAYLRKVYFKSITIMLIAGFGLAAVYLVVLPEILRLLLPNYLSSINILRILALAIPFIFIHIPSNQLLLSTEKHLKQLIFIYFGLFLINLLLYLIFIPPFGPIGAAWVTVWSELSTFVALFLYLTLKVFKRS